MNPRAKGASPSQVGGATDGGASPRTRHAWVGVLALLVLVAVFWPARWGGWIGFISVSGHSMEPTFATGDLAVTMRQPGYRIGDVIAYQVPAGQPGAGGRVIHRIVATRGSNVGLVFITKGDNNPTSDVWLPHVQDVMGRVVFRVPGGPFGSTFLIAIVPALAVTILLWPNTRMLRGRHSPVEGRG